MATREITGSNPRSFEPGTTIAIIAAGFSLIVTIAVVVSMQLSLPPTRVSQPAGNVTLGRQDDFAQRHMAGSGSLGREADYWQRHSAGAPSLGRQDDYGLRSTAVAPSLGREDDYFLRHTAGQ